MFELLLKESLKEVIVISNIFLSIQNSCITYYIFDRVISDLQCWE